MKKNKSEGSHRKEYPVDNYDYTCKYFDLLEADNHLKLKTKKTPIETMKAHAKHWHKQ